MRIKILRPFIIVLISAFLCFVAIKTIQACGYAEEPDSREYSVFTPEIINQPYKEPFFLSYRYYYGHDYYGIPETIPTLTERNTEEWVALFNNRIEPEFMAWLLYISKIYEVELIRRNFAGEKISIDTFNTVQLSKLRSEKNILPILDYIIIAKKAEKYFNPDYSSWGPPTYDSTSIEQLIPFLKKNFSQAPGSFLKNRYGFMLTRALCINNQYKECIQFFDTEFKPTKEAGSMHYRSLGYKARAYYRLRGYSQANYIYSYLYENDPCGRYSAFQSFHPQEENDWYQTLQLAKSTREKEVLWHMLGVYADPLRGMKEIYLLNPKSDLLALLLVRSVNMAEEYALSNPIRYGDFYDYNYSVRPNNQESLYEGFGFGPEHVRTDSLSNKSLLSFIDQVTKDNKVLMPAVWKLSAAYLYLLNGALNASNKALSGLQVDPKDSLLSGQFEIIKGLLAVRKTTTLNTSQEKLLYGHIQNILASGGRGLRKDNAVRYMLSQLSVYYDRKKDSLKRELCYPQGARFYRQSSSVQQMINFMSRKYLNEMERFLVDRYPLKIPDLYEVKAISLMYEYRFSEAVKEFEKAGDVQRENLYGNPFTIRIKDCHDCDHQAEQKTKYNRYTFAKKMVELKARGDTSRSAEERAQNYFLYANGLYNMTWYGNGRLIRESRVYHYYELYYGETNKELRKSRFYNCSEAMKWYQKALSISKNKEFRAKCTWMSAKCEHNIWLEKKHAMESDQENADFTFTDKDFVAGKYFNQMKNEYADTKYYQEALKECGYFCTFITRSDKCIKDTFSLRR